MHAAIGNLVLLRREPDQLEGRFDSGNATFMQIRSPDFRVERADTPLRDRHDATHRTTSLTLERVWENGPLWFLVHLREEGRIEFGYAMDAETGRPGPVFFTSRDGSWCELSTSGDGIRHVWEGGPRRLRASIEDDAALWHEQGEPGWSRFGLTVRRERQWVWLDDPDGPLAWPLGGRADPGAAERR
ncbi:hypothetical protein [Amycolatopsis cihanbeyliensis]|uniref:hypothetical protein n=1 Tax=Amycolatopsis cihanbeyliensis TaxID=1128664 RepID=UPI0011539CE2|nr:hypothetical protein [Amycolatopsis cihanbeyliensis]